MKGFFLAACLVLSSAGMAQGRLEPQVPYGGGGRGLAIFHPSAGPRAKEPVLLLFDPGGDGLGAVKRCMAAAEVQGVTLVGVLDFRDGLADPVYADLLAHLRTEIQRRFPRARVWAGGFSGGARISVGWAQEQPGWIQGLLCFGAFYDRGGLPPGQRPVFLACGTSDFDLAEMLRARGELEKAGCPTAWRAFKGGHRWPPPDVLAEALAFVRIHAPGMGSARHP